MRLRMLAAVLVLSLVLTPAVSADGKKSKTYRQGDVYCTAAALVMGSLVVQGGRCYLLAIYRDTRGTFLAFINPAVLIAPGQVVNLDSAQGRRLRGHILYLVPIQATGLVVGSIAVNTIQLVSVREERHGDDEDEDQVGRNRTVLVISGLPFPNLSVTFVVRF